MVFATGSNSFVTRCLFFLIGVTIFNGISAQVIGEDICGCSPSSYRFTLDFTVDPKSVCNQPNIEIGPGISDTRCFIIPLRNPTVNDLVPVTVTTIELFEYGQDMSLIAEERIDGIFIQDDFFDYESVTFRPEDITSPLDIPRSIQISLTGTNANREEIVSVAIINMTNSCYSRPNLEIGDSIGFILFSGLESPHESVCPIVA